MGVGSRLRDLNDEINKLIREKGHWEKRIVEMGGPDYAKAAPKVCLSPFALNPAVRSLQFPQDILTMDIIAAYHSCRNCNILHLACLQAHGLCSAECDLLKPLCASYTANV